MERINLMRVRYRASNPIGDDGIVDMSLVTPSRHAPYLISLLQMFPNWKQGAEVGVAKGRTLLPILEHTHMHMLAVDAFEYVEDSEKSLLYETMPHDDNERVVREITEAFPGRVDILKGLSWEQASRVQARTLDFVFIDASHMYEEVKADIEAWGPKVKDTGWIMGHDYCPQWDGVRRAVDETMGCPVQFPETMWAHQATALYGRTD